MSILWFIIVILLVIWFSGYAMNIGGNWVHILFLMAILLTLIKLIKE